MPIRAVMFDIGGVLEVIPEGGDPATRFPALDDADNWTFTVVRDDSVNTQDC
jgi:hypothetical protein